MWRRAGDKFGTRHYLNEERKKKETRPGCRGWVEIRARGHNRLWRTRRPPMEECGDESTRHSQPTYGEAWRWEHETQLGEMRARHSWRWEHETQLGEMRARHTAGDESTRHSWRRRRSAMEEKRGAERGSNEGREGTNGKWAETGRQQVATGSQFFLFSFFFLFSMAEIKTIASNGYKKSEVWYLPQHHRTFPLEKISLHRSRSHMIEDMLNSLSRKG